MCFIMLLSMDAVFGATIPFGNDASAASVANVIGDDCNIPSEEELVRIFAESGEFFAYIVGSEDDGHTSDTTEERQRTKTNSTSATKTATMGNLHCPVGKSVDRSAPLRLRSVCPWDLSDDHDSNRFPKTIQKAVCMCANCIDPSSNELNENQSCTPVYYPMPVLRRTGCKDGVATFEPRYEQVPVACDCKFPKKRHNTHKEVPAKKM